MWPCWIRLPSLDHHAVTVFVWRQELDPAFPLAVLEYRTGDGEDRMHWHDHLEIALVLAGRGRFLFGHREHPAEPGDLFFIDNSQPHVAVGDPSGPLRLLLVLFRPELVAGPGCRAFDAGYLAPFRTDERVFAGRVAAGSPLAQDLAAALLDLSRTADRHDPADRHLLDAGLRRVLGTIVRELACDGGPVRSAADRREQIRPVLAYIDRHCRESITLDDVAEVVHVSPSRVRHVFKDVTGVGFKEYVTNVRVAEAKRLLLGSDVSVAEIARSVGYTNLHQFYRVFYRSSAMSPAEYRRYYTPAGAGEAGDEPTAGAGEAGDELPASRGART
jgi:AraC-like DNA-binding protein/mannose-6-phosphate isomerase-like protein (cupin superfamily)